MPIGTHHIESGLLLRDGRNLVLRIDGGGEWRLDADPRSEHLLGRRVTVDARRDGFDLLGVDAIWPEGELRAKSKPFTATWTFALGIALPVALAIAAMIIG